MAYEYKPDPEPAWVEAWLRSLEIQRAILEDQREQAKTEPVPPKAERERLWRLRDHYNGW